MAEVNAVQAVGDNEVVVFARSEAELAQSQAALTAWAEQKVKDLRAELADLRENFSVAVKRKWRSEPFRRQVARAEKRVAYYEKVRAALAAGYVIVPNFETLDVFAIRTTRKSPARNQVIGDWERPKEQQTNSPPAAEGRYVNAEGKVQERKIPKNLGGKPVVDSAGKQQLTTQRWVKEFADVDFPFRTAKPAVLNATSEAMALRIFDDLGVLPRRREHGDPMVIGRVRLREGYNNKMVSFLIAWFVDTRAL